MIRRYTYDPGDGNWRFPGHVGRDDGEWVKYEDYQDELTKLANEYADAMLEAYEKGKQAALQGGYVKDLEARVRDLDTLVCELGEQLDMKGMC
jgi:hypothetical protein